MNAKYILLIAFLLLSVIIVNASVTVDSSADSIATAYQNRNFCIDPSGTFWTCYLDTGDDLTVANSTDNGDTWNIQADLNSGSVTMAGAVCFPNGTIGCWEIRSNDVFLYSSDDGFSTVQTITTTTITSADAVPDNENNIHFCAIDSADDLRYINNTVETEISAVDSRHCDINYDTDTGELYIGVLDVVGGDDLDEMTSEDGWSTRTELEGGAGSISSGLYAGVSSFLKDSVRYYAFVASSDLWFGTYDGTTASFSEIDSSNSLSPSLFVSDAGQCYLLYQSASTATGVFYWANSSDCSTWDTRNQIVSSAGFGDFPDETSNTREGKLDFIYTDSDLMYSNFSIYYNNYSLTVNYPTSSNILETSNGSDEQIGFDIFDLGIKQTEGITVHNITINGEYATIKSTEVSIQSPTIFDYNDDESLLYACGDDVASDPPSGVPHTAFNCAGASDLGNITSNACLDSSDDSKCTSSYSNSVDGFLFEYSSEMNTSKNVTVVSLHWEGANLDNALPDQKMYVYNDSSSSWILCDTNVDPGLTDQTLDCTFNNPIGIFNETFEMSVVVLEDGVYSARLSTDFFYFNITRSDVFQYSYFQQCGYNESETVCNITTPNLDDGTYDFFINATIDGNLLNQTSTNSVQYGDVVLQCYESSPLTEPCEIDCNDNPTISSDLDCDDNALLTTNGGSGSLIIEGDLLNCPEVTLSCNEITRT